MPTGEIILHGLDRIGHGSPVSLERTVQHIIIFSVDPPPSRPNVQRPSVERMKVRHIIDERNRAPLVVTQSVTGELGPTVAAKTTVSCSDPRTV